MMAGEVVTKIKGTREMEVLLKQLGPEIANKVGDQALRNAAKPIIEEAKRLVPKKSGALHDAIVAQVQRKPQDDDTRLIFLGFRKRARGSPSSRAHLIEFGTAHSAARPFMRPAMDSQAGEALEQMGKTLARGINREAKKLAKPIK